MEDILASIRRIIADDNVTKSLQRAQEPPKAELRPMPAVPPPPPPLAKPSYSAPPPPPPLPKPSYSEPPPPPPLAKPSYSAPPVTPPRPSFEAEWSDAAEERRPMRGEAVADHSSAILGLTESMSAPMPQPSAAISPPSAMPESAPQFRTIDGSSAVGFEEASEKSVAHAPAPGGEERGQLISSETSAAVDSAFNALAQMVLVQKREDLVREMLRPMLKSWLDDNLPGVVERLVRAEIERVSHGRAS